MSKIASNFKGYDNIFSVRLRELVNKTKTTQQQLAEETNCSRQAISQYLDGSNAPNVEKLSNIAQFFNVSTDYLLGLTDIQSPDVDVKAICKDVGLSEEAYLCLKNRQGQLDVYGKLNIQEMSLLNAIIIDMCKCYSSQNNLISQMLFYNGLKSNYLPNSLVEELNAIGFRGEVSSKPFIENTAFSTLKNSIDIVLKMSNDMVNETVLKSSAYGGDNHA